MALITQDDIYNPPGTPELHTDGRSHSGPLVKRRPMTLNRVINAVFLEMCSAPAELRSHFMYGLDFLFKVEDANR